LFLVYINDIVDNIESNIKLFADDTVLYVDVDRTSQAEEILRRDMETMQQWSEKWLVNFNETKTVAMKISLKHNQDPYPQLTMKGNDLQIVGKYRHLGLEFNEKLSWNDHVNSMIAKANRNMATIRHLKYKLDRKTLEVLYTSFIRPTLEYGSVVWDSCNEDCKKKLDTVHLDAARIVTGAIKGTEHDALYQETGWESLQDRKDYEKLVLFHKMIHNEAPQYLNILVPPKRGELNPYSSKFADEYDVPSFRTEQYHKTFLPSIVEKWNKLSDDIKNIEKTSEFKRKLKHVKPKQVYMYCYGKRTANVIHSRLRMNCSCLKAHLYKLHVIDDATCNCRTSKETSEHFLLYCPLYRNKREKMMNRIVSVLGVNHQYITGDILLFGDIRKTREWNEQLFDIVHDYLVSSQRFD